MPESKKAALFVAHPSHELRVYGWLLEARPKVYILTDGGGRSNEPRLPRTTAVADRLGLERGSIYGRVGDLELYDLILEQKAEAIIAMAEELADELVAGGIEMIAGDAPEGYSSAHDTARLLIDAAVAIARNKHGRDIENYDFLVMGPPDECPEALREDAIWIRLDDKAFAQKIAAACAYTDKLRKDVEAAMAGEKFFGVKRFSEPEIAGKADEKLTNVLEEALQSHPRFGEAIRSLTAGCDIQDFRTECLRPVEPWSGGFRIPSEPPLYEIYGEELVSAGRYERVIRFRDHMLPIGDRVRDHVASLAPAVQ